MKKPESACCRAKCSGLLCKLALAVFVRVENPCARKLKPDCLGNRGRSNRRSRARIAEAPERVKPAQRALRKCRSPRVAGAAGVSKGLLARPPPSVRPPCGLPRANGRAHAEE